MKTKICRQYARAFLSSLFIASNESHFRVPDGEEVAIIHEGPGGMKTFIRCMGKIFECLFFEYLGVYEMYANLDSV